MRFNFLAMIGGDEFENVRYNLLEFLKKHNKLTPEDINQICDCCSKVDMNYLNQ